MLKEALQNALNGTSPESERLKKMIKEKHFPKKQILFYQDDPIDYLYLVIDGIVVADHDEITHYHEMLLPGIIFPLFSLHGNREYPYEALALTDVTVWRIQRDSFVRFLDDYPRYYRALCQDLLMIGQYIAYRNDDLASEEVMKRIEHTLCNLLYYYGERQQNDYVLPYPITVTEMAYLSHTTRSTTSRVIQKFKQQHKVYYENKQLAMTTKEVEMNKVNLT